MSKAIDMAPPSTEETDADEPTSYSHIENALNKAIGRETAKEVSLRNARKVSYESRPPHGEEAKKGDENPAPVRTILWTAEKGQSSIKNPSIGRTTEKSARLADDGVKVSSVVIGGVSNGPIASAQGVDLPREDTTVPPTITVAIPKDSTAHQTTKSLSSDAPVRSSAQSNTAHRTSSRSRSSSGSGNSPKSKPLRRGKWTTEEEAYVARVIKDFNAGILNAPAGTTLRSYLSEKLQCDPMRITKKFTGDSCIGKRVFHPTVRNPSNAAAIDQAQAELDALEKRWRRRLEAQQRESAKKLSSPVQSNGRISGITAEAQRSLAGGPVSATGLPSGQNVVTRTAAWLDQANAILGVTNDSQGAPVVPSLAVPLAPVPVEELGSAEIENQMKEVQRLISEGQQTSAGLSHMLAQQPPPPQVDAPHYATSIVSDAEPADKRMRRTSMSGAEDAEALVGFLRSVRASAASGLTE